MIDTNRVTDALPAVSCSVSPLDFVDLDYSPSLLLPVPFDAVLVENAEYQEACKGGFDMYFQDVCADEHLQSREKIVPFINHEIFFQPSSYWGEPLSLVYRIGFVVGYFSALALTERSLALYGLDLLTCVVANMAR